MYNIFMEQKKNIHAGHRNRMKETFLDAGLKSFSEVEKLEFLLFFAIPQKDTNPISHALLDEFGSLEHVLAAPIQSLSKVKGVGEHAALMIKMIYELLEGYGNKKEKIVLSGSSSAKVFAQRLLLGKKEENFACICVNAKNEICSHKILAKGTNHTVAASIRSITNYCISASADRIIVVHNHPEGDTTPSDQDLSFTRALVCSCYLNEIQVLDHIIVSDTEAYSMEEHSILPLIRSSAYRAISKESDIKPKLSQTQLNYRNDALK